MFGKASLIFVVGFGLIFSLYQMRLSRMTARASDTFNEYYVSSLVHEAANSAMNVAVNDVWRNGTDSTDFLMIANQCTTRIRIRPLGADTIRASAISRARVVNEDYLAEVGGSKPIIDSVYALFVYDTPLTRWFSFTNSEATHMGLRQYWMSGDTAWGPIHTNNIFYTFGSPVFYEKITSQMGFKPDPRHAPAEYIGGWEVGLNQPVPTDMSGLIQAAGLDGSAINVRTRYDEDLWVEFLPDGTARRAIGEFAEWPLDPAVWDTVSLAWVAPNTVVMTSEDIHVKGTLNGTIILYAGGSDSDIYIYDDLVYTADPTVDPTVDDLLGLVSKNDIIVVDNAATNDGVTIHGCLLAIQGSFWAEDWDSNPPAVSPLRFVGSLGQNYRGPVGAYTGNGSWHVNGFERDYHYDPRLRTLTLPWFPSVHKLRLASWWE